MSGSAIVWFRKGLRLHDNLALQKALEAKPKHLYPVFCLDPWFLNPEKVGAVRLRFLLQSLRDLDKSLRALNSRFATLWFATRATLGQCVRASRASKFPIPRIFTGLIDFSLNNSYNYGI